MIRKDNQQSYILGSIVKKTTMKDDRAGAPSAMVRKLAGDAVLLCCTITKTDLSQPMSSAERR
jgi:hypothetical protein